MNTRYTFARAINGAFAFIFLLFAAASVIVMFVPLRRGDVRDPGWHAIFPAVICITIAGVFIWRRRHWQKLARRDAERIAHPRMD